MQHYELHSNSPQFKNLNQFAILFQQYFWGLNLFSDCEVTCYSVASWKEEHNLNFTGSNQSPARPLSLSTYSLQQIPRELSKQKIDISLQVSKISSHPFLVIYGILSDLWF